MLEGRCLCGAVSYVIDQTTPVVVAHCHCVDCQRVSGAGHTTGAMFPVEAVRFIGEVAEFDLVSDKGNTVTRTFCPKCGSPLYGRNTGMEGMITITVGTLDTPDAVAPQVAIYARTRRHWDAMDPALPTFAEQPDWKPEDGV